MNGMNKCAANFCFSLYRNAENIHCWEFEALPINFLREQKQKRFHAAVDFYSHLFAILHKFAQKQHLAISI
jgi:predicted LPLAT superfamily acyltransferase